MKRSTRMVYLRRRAERWFSKGKSYKWTAAKIGVSVTTARCWWHTERDIAAVCKFYDRKMQEDYRVIERAAEARGRAEGAKIDQATYERTIADVTRALQEEIGRLRAELREARITIKSLQKQE